MTSNSDRRVYVGKTNLAILSGEEDLSLWSEEDLIRGQKRGKNGKWGGRPPKLVPKVLHDELVKRKLTRAYELLNESIYDAVAVLVDVAKDPEADASVRIKAATEILNRTIGKPTEKVKLDLAVKSRFEEACEAMIVPDDHVVEAESWEADDT